MLDYIENSILNQKQCLAIAQHALENAEKTKQIEELKLRIKSYEFAIQRLSNYNGMKSNQYSIDLRKENENLKYRMSGSTYMHSGEASAVVRFHQPVPN